MSEHQEKKSFCGETLECQVTSRLNDAVKLGEFLNGVWCVELGFRSGFGFSLMLPVP